MKKNQIFILLYILIPSYLFAQEGELENPYYWRNIIHKSILLFKKKLEESSNYYNDKDDYLLINEENQVIENEYFGKNIYDEIKEFLPFRGEKGIFEEENKRRIFNRLYIKNGELYFWKVYVFHLFSDYTCIIFRKYFFYNNDEGIFSSSSESEALFLYKYDKEKKEFCLDKALFDSSIPKN